MLCPNCQIEFDSGAHLPRILIFCGHTYCQSCIEQLLQQSTDESHGKTFLHCPECDIQNIAHDGVNSFPKNLVLLQVNSSQVQASTQNKINGGQQETGLGNNQYNLQKQNSNQNNKIIRENSQKSNNSQSSANSQQQQEQQKILCPLHGKKLEAFCEKDLQVLCIDCILSESHKSHEIISVQKAAEKQKQLLYDEVSNAQKTEEKLRFILSDIKRHVQDMHSTADKNRKELSSIYSFIRDLILEREQTLKRQISENLTKEEQETEVKQGEINEFMGGISQLKQELLSQNNEHDIEILMKSKQRAQLSSEVNGYKSRELTSFSIQAFAGNSLSLQEIKREQELTQISKIISPSYKGPAIGQTIGTANASSNLYQHTASTANKMKKANTQNPTQMSSNFTNGLGSYSNPFQNQPEKIQKDEKKGQGKQNNHNASNSINQNQMKTKVSPHRIQQKKGDISGNQTKKQGVVVLDQNKQKSGSNTHLNKNSSKCQNSFQNAAIQQNQINLYNFNQYGQQLSTNPTTQSGNQDEMGEDVLGNIGPEDVSSIYPLETNDCYFQYQDLGQNGVGRNDFVRRDESVGNLNDLLESLNKSNGQDHLGIGVNDSEKQGSSTASETGGSHSEIKTPPQQELKLKQVKSNLDSPKVKRGNNNNAWKNQPQQIKNKSGKKNLLKKDNSATDLEDIKIKNSKLINLHQHDAVINHQYLPLEESKNDIPRSGSLQRYSSNGFLQNEPQHPSPGKRYVFKGQQQTFDDSGLKKTSQQYLDGQNMLNNHQLCSLSQERAKRKQQKIGALAASQESSPFKIDNKGAANNNQLMDILQECTKNIDKLEFRPKQMKLGGKIDSNQESPVKLLTQNSSKAAVCIVDLTKRDDELILTARKNGADERADQIDRNEEEEGTHLKNIPNMTKPKEQSPLKKGFTQSEQRSISSSPSKQQILRSTESMDNLMVQVVRNHDISLDLGRSSNHNQFTQDTTMQQSVSVDTSVSDPFRAFCKIREEFIFVFSGFNDQKLLTCEALDVQRGTWKVICEIGKARTKFSAVPISKSRILIFGGKQADGQRTGEIEEFNLKTNKFKTLPFKLPKPRSGFSACVKREEGKIFFCGGNSGTVLKKFDCLDLKKGKWSRWPEMIQKRDELAVALGPDGKIYAIGGYGGGSSSQSNNTGDDRDGQSNNQSSNCLRTAERFDFSTGEWEMLPEMNEARRALAAVALPDGIYAIGGYDGKQYLSSVEKFDLQKQQWIPVKSMNTSRCTLSAVVSSDCQYIYALGGFNGASLDLVERYNTMTDEWEFVTPMITKRFMHEAVCLVTH